MEEVVCDYVGCVEFVFVYMREVYFVGLLSLYVVGEVWDFWINWIVGV